MAWNCFCPLTTLPQAEWPPGLRASVPLSWSLAARSRLDDPSDPHIWDLVLSRAVAGNISIVFVTQRVSVDPYSIARTVLGTVEPLEKRQVWVLPSGWERCRGGTDTNTRQCVLSAQWVRQREQGSEASQAGGSGGFIEEGGSDLDDRGEGTGEGTPDEGIP